MTRSRVNSRVFLPAPIRGLDFRIPIFNMPEEYSPFMVNFMAENGAIYRRRGHSRQIVLSSGASFANIIIPYTGAGGFQEIGIGRSKTANTTTEVNTPTDILAPNHDWHIFKENIMIAGTNGNVYILNPSTLAYSVGLTYTQSSVNVQRKPITSYRERVYIGDGFSLHYGGIGATSGAMTIFSVQNLINGVGIVGLETFTITEGFNTQHYLVLVSSVGEVLIYAGAFPGASDWTLVTKLKISLPPGDNNFPLETVAIPNDILICPKYGPQVYSIRQLLVEGVAASSFSYLEPIRPFLESYQATTDLSSGQISIRKSVCFWAQKNSLVVATENYSTLPPVLVEWATSIGYSTSATIIVFLIDIGTGVCTLHTAIDTSSGEMAGQLRSQAHYVGLPGFLQQYQLFNQARTAYYDWGGSSDFYKCVAVLPPPRTAGYRNKSVKNLLMYSNLLTNHDFEHGLNKNFSFSPANLTTFRTANTNPKTHIDVMPGSQIGNGIVTTFTELSINTTPFTFYGMDMILEDGGEY